jgi:ubiquinone/menaquinone biosynthesis C-methylase UbiE
MIAHARGKFASQLPIRFCCANGEQLPFHDCSFDVVASCSAYHFMPDRSGVLEEMARVLVPGGRLVITDWCADYLMCRLLDCWLVFTRRAAHSGSLRSHELRSLLNCAGFTERHVQTYRVGWLWGLVTVVAEKGQPDC